MRPSGLTRLGAVILCLLLAGIPALADDVNVPVVGGADTTVGSEGRQSISPPGDGFENPVVESSNTGVVTVDKPDTTAAGCQGFDFKTTGKGVAVVTITWTNPKTKETKKQYVAVG